jgi:hypothetical protein
MDKNTESQLGDYLGILKKTHPEHLRALAEFTDLKINYKYLQSPPAILVMEIPLSYFIKAGLAKNKIDKAISVAEDIRGKFFHKEPSGTGVMIYFSAPMEIVENQPFWEKRDLSKEKEYPLIRGLLSINFELIKRLIEQINSPIKLENLDLDFDSEKGVLSTGEVTCTFPLGILQYALVKKMFEESVLSPIPWDSIAELMRDEHLITDDKARKARVRDAMKAANKRIKRALKISEDLFVMKSDRVIRLF